MDKGILWYPYHERYLPYIYRELDITPDTIVFMGQFRLESEALPVEGIFINQDSWVHARIDSKEIIEQEEEDDDNHKGAFYDEDMGGYIRLFPEDECIQITYTVLKNLPTKEDVQACMEHIEKAGREIWERSEEIRLKREEVEHEVWLAERNRLFAEQQAKATTENVEMGAIIPDIILEDIYQKEEVPNVNSKHTKYCGCENDPYPDDLSCGREVTLQEFSPEKEGY